MNDRIFAWIALAIGSLVVLFGGAGCASDYPDFDTDQSPAGVKRDDRIEDDRDPPGSPSKPKSAPLADPLPDTPEGQWSWLGAESFGDVPTCMDGSKTGLGVNRAPGGATKEKRKLLVFMQGGGACFNGQTCALADMATSTDHHDAQDFAAWSKKAGRANVMNRERAENPFRDWDYVFIPYCSGDVFAGDTPSGFDNRPQLGYKNVAAYLPRLASTFRNAEQVVLTGMSAGGYGAAYNFVPFQRAFSWVDVTMIDDSGPTFSTKFTPTCLQEKWKQVWQMTKTSPIEGPLPLGLDPVSGTPGAGLFALFQEVVRAHPKNKFVFISHARDLVMRYFHGIGHTRTCNLPFLLSASFYEEGLRDIRSMQGDNFSTFYGPGTGHPYFRDDAEMYETKVDGITLADWLRKVVTTKDEPRRVPAQF